MEKMSPTTSNSNANAGSTHGGAPGVLSASLIPTYRFTIAGGIPIAGIAQ